MNTEALQEEDPDNPLSSGKYSAPAIMSDDELEAIRQYMRDSSFHSCVSHANSCSSVPFGDSQRLKAIMDLHGVAVVTGVCDKVELEELQTAFHEDHRNLNPDPTSAMAVSVTLPRLCHADLSPLLRGPAQSRGLRSGCHGSPKRPAGMAPAPFTAPTRRPSLPLPAGLQGLHRARPQGIPFPNRGSPHCLCWILPHPMSESREVGLQGHGP